MKDRTPILIALIVIAAVVAIYFLVSPYRNCLRHAGEDFGWSEAETTAFCKSHTVW